MGLFDWLFGKQDKRPPAEDDERGQPQFPPAEDDERDQPQVPPAEDDERDQPQVPPTPQRVAARAMVLGLVLYRASIEQFRKDAAFKKLHALLPEWIDRLGLAAELEPQEDEMLRARLGRADPRVVTNAAWRSEGLAVLAWALNRFELPVYDQLADPRAATASVGFAEEKLAAMDTAAAKDLLLHAEIRPVPAIGMFASHITVVGWRLRQFGLQPGPMDYASYLRAYPNFKEHWLENVRIINGDLAIGDQAIADAPAEDVATCEGSAVERQIAAYWLQGDGPIYSEVDPSTLLSCA